MNENITEEMLWVWMTKLGKPMNKAIDLVYSCYGTPQKAWNAEKMTEEEIKKSDKPVFFERIFSEKIKEDAMAEYEKTMKAGIRIITRKSVLYPENLSHIYNPPPVLYCLGKLPAEVKKDMLLLAVVGSRACTAYGRNMTYKIAGELALSGIGIVSGLARGIDISAHIGALDAGGYTIAVMGGGPDIIYPPEHKKVYEKIAGSGCIISEHPAGVEPVRNFFPARNRIIAGLSQGTFVTEAGRSSGAMITVDRALEEGREVFALPGNIDSGASDGTNELIKKGAVCVTGTEDILESFAYLEGCDTLAFSYDPEKHPGDGSEYLTENEKKVYKMINIGKGRPENAETEEGLTPGEISAALTRMEVKGIIKKEPSGSFSVKKFFTI